MKRIAALVLGCALALGVATRSASAAPPLETLPGEGRIEIRYEHGLESAAERLRDAAEQSLKEISADLRDLPTPDVIHIQLVRDASELAAVAPQGRGAPAYAIGVAYPDLGVLSIAMRRGGTGVDPVATLEHELAHLALGAAVGNRAPRWLHEGFAYQHSPEWSWDRTETLAGMAWFGGIVPYDELSTRFPDEELPANRAYAESYDLVGFLTVRGRWEDGSDHGDRRPFRELLAELAHGATIDAAAIHAYGVPMRTLYDEWRESLGKRYLFAPVGLLALAIWVFAAILLALAWRKRRRQYRTRIAMWEREEAAAAAARQPESEPEPEPEPGDEPARDPNDPRWFN